MATKFERALIRASSKASAYVESNKSYLSKQYCMSSDQLRTVQDAYYRGFLDGVNFK